MLTVVYDLYRLLLPVSQTTWFLICIVHLPEHLSITLTQRIMRVTAHRHITFPSDPRLYMGNTWVRQLMSGIIPLNATNCSVSRQAYKPRHQGWFITYTYRLL